MLASEKMFRLYFDCVYPYTPIFNRVEFLQNFETASYSIFLVQCILTSAAPYAPLELLQEAGFNDRHSACVGLFNRARLLYDFGVEKGQVPLLQGCLSLSLVSFAAAMDKDYRFWLTNAIRLATNMGLHRNDMTKGLDPPTTRLFRRLWWILYNRDLTNVVTGLDNIRRTPTHDADISLLSGDDWDDEPVPERFRHVIPPLLQIHKSFIIASCELSQISKCYSSVSWNHRLHVTASRGLSRLI
jgi:hypothetical protein